MKVLKQISVYSMLLMMIFSSLGISFYLHDCHCSGDTTLSFGTGFSDHKMVSCCSPSATAACQNDQEPAVGKKSCCEDRVYFYLLPVAPYHVAQYFSPIAEKILFDEFTKIIDNTELSSVFESFPLLHDPPLLLSGKVLVYFISQIKIPYPVS